MTDSVSRMELLPVVVCKVLTVPWAGIANEFESGGLFLWPIFVENAVI